MWVTVNTSNEIELNSFDSRLLDIRDRIVKALCYLNHPTTTFLLQPALENDNSEIRSAAAQEKRDKSELFYSFFSPIKPRQPKGTSTQDDWESHVLPHGEIEELAPNLWHLTGTLPSATIAPREMILYRLADGSLLIHSAIALNEPGMAKLESLGTPSILIVPNRIHRLDASVYESLANNIPDLQVISVAHGSPIVTDCSTRLREAAARLL